MSTEAQCASIVPDPGLDEIEDVLGGQGVFGRARSYASRATSFLSAPDRPQLPLSSGYFSIEAKGSPASLCQHL